LFNSRFRFLKSVSVILCCLTTPLVSYSASPAAKKDVVDYVDPFIGSDGQGEINGQLLAGNVGPAATLPFGFIQVGPDTEFDSKSSGYKFSKKITGFSQQHISGMAGPMFGEISIFPLTGELKNPSKLVASGKSAEAASPGYYTVTTAPWNVKVELTAARHVALHRHTFPANDQAHVLVNVGHVLYGREKANWYSSKPIGGEVNVDPVTQEVYGYMLYFGSRSNYRKWKVYFSAQFDTRFDSYGTWDDKAVLTDGSTRGVGNEIGAYLNFKSKEGQVVNSKIAVSFRSVEQARGYFAETPAWDFDAVKANARAEWSTALNKIQVEGGTEDQRKLFYTSLYRMHTTPNDWTGEQPPHYGNEPYYDNMLCMWDTFRTVYPMLTLIQPKVQTDIVNSILNYYKYDGWTGDAHSAWMYEHVQNGSSADVIVADAYAKNYQASTGNTLIRRFARTLMKSTIRMVFGDQIKGVTGLVNIANTASCQPM
jgi:predicted alpha-1,2-mannosidase